VDYSKFKNRVCENIKTMRLKKNLTQLDLASKCNIERSNLARLEAGKSSPTLKSLFLIAEALEVEVKDLLE
jgi:transcriptional regulator with XRE-family HTH domain